MTFEKRKKTRAARKTIWYSFNNEEMLLEGKVEEEMQTEMEVKVKVKMEVEVKIVMRLEMKREKRLRLWSGRKGWRS